MRLKNSSAIIYAALAISITILVIMVAKFYFDSFRLQNTQVAVGPGKYVCEIKGNFSILLNLENPRGIKIDRGDEIVLGKGETLYYTGGSSIWDQIYISITNKEAVSKKK